MTEHPLRLIAFIISMAWTLMMLVHALYLPLATDAWVAAHIPRLIRMAGVWELTIAFAIATSTSWKDAIGPATLGVCFIVIAPWLAPVFRIDKRRDKR